jgi:hypothetical protein
MSRMLKSICLMLLLAWLAACETTIPITGGIPTATRLAASSTLIPTHSPVAPSPTPSLTATSTSTPLPPTLTATPHDDPARQTQEAEEFCYLDPRKALDDYLTFLYQGDYEKAARLYARPFLFEEKDTLPEDLDITERIAFYAQYLEEFCRGYGTCLKHRIIREETLSARSELSEEVQRRSEGEVIIWVEFYKENGSVLEVVIPKGDGFELYTTFDFIVVKLDGCYKSIYTPPMTA